MATAKLNFEDAMSRLEEIVKQLESGNTSLDASLKLYEEGIRLVRFCGEKLDSAEKTLKVYRAVPDGDDGDNGDNGSNGGDGDNV